MWHDARKQEKLIRKTLVDQSKRGEKRRRFFDAVRADPDQFMQIHGRRAIIHTEAGVAKAAEDAAVLRPWQGDGKILIDRFDARSHLDHIQKPTHREVAKDSPEAKMEILCDFERYRILIINEYRKVGEKEYLKKIAEAEYWHKSSHATQKAIRLQEAEKKKKSAASKAAVGFSYEDSDVVRGRPEGEDSGESESDEEDEADMEDIDVELDVSHLCAESARKANLLGESFGVSRCSFIDLQMAETAWARNQAELKQIEREKLAISGKNGRRERRQLKYRRQLILGKGVVGNEDAHMSLLAMIGAKDTKKEGEDDSSSSSDSDCNDFGKTVFIRSLDASGKVEEDEEEPAATTKVQGPTLPNQEYRRILSLTKKRSESPQPFEKREEKGWRGVARRNERSRSPRRRSRSRDRDRHTTSSRGGRSRSRERRRGSRERRSPRRRSRSRDRSTSRDRQKRKRRNNSSSSQSSTPRRRREERGEREKRSAERRAPSLSDSDDGSNGAVDDEPMLSIHSSMSEDEREKREIENRKRRIRKTKAMIKAKNRAPSSAQSTDTEEEEKKRMAGKIRQRMQKNLSKTVDELRAEKEDKRKEKERYLKVREVELENERERMKRARDDDKDRARRGEKDRKEDRRGGRDERGRDSRDGRGYYRRRSRSRS